MNDQGSPLELLLFFASVSLLAIGGANSVMPEILHQSVEVRHWMTNSEFSDLYAIARASPGPNMLIVSLIGWKASGFWGALAATIGMCGPSCTLTYLVNRLWDRFRHTRWRAAVQRGLAPVTIGLVLASGYVLAQVTTTGWASYLVLAATIIVVMASKINPLWVLAAAGSLGAVGLV